MDKCRLIEVLQRAARIGPLIVRPKTWRQATLTEERWIQLVMSRGEKDGKNW